MCRRLKTPRINKKMIENLVTLLKQDKIEEAFKLSEQLRQEGTAITTIRHTVYEVFKVYRVHNIDKAKQIVEIFGEDYKFRYWLNPSVH